MSKKVLILTSSPRKNSNTTKMALAFAKGAQRAGHEIFYFDAAAHDIKGCKACDACWSKGEACVANDDFNQLAALMEKCDVLLLSCPLYFLGFPAQVKGAIDKLYSYRGTGVLRPLAIKESYFFVCGAAGNKEEYKPIIQSYQIAAEFIGWKDRGIIQISDVDAPGALEASGVLEQAEEMGRNI